MIFELGFSSLFFFFSFFFLLILLFPPQEMDGLPKPPRCPLFFLFSFFPFLRPGYVLFPPPPRRMLELIRKCRSLAISAFFFFPFFFFFFPPPPLIIRGEVRSEKDVDGRDRLDSAGWTLPFLFFFPPRRAAFKGEENLKRSSCFGVPVSFFSFFSFFLLPSLPPFSSQSTFFFSGGEGKRQALFFSLLPPQTPPLGVWKGASNFGTPFFFPILPPLLFFMQRPTFLTSGGKNTETWDCLPSLPPPFFFFPLPPLFQGGRSITTSIRKQTEGYSYSGSHPFYFFPSLFLLLPSPLLVWHHFRSDSCVFIGQGGLGMGFRAPFFFSHPLFFLSLFFSHRDAFISVPQSEKLAAAPPFPFFPFLPLFFSFFPPLFVKQPHQGQKPRPFF